MKTTINKFVLNSIRNETIRNNTKAEILNISFMSSYELEKKLEYYTELRTNECDISLYIAYSIVINYILKLLKLKLEEDMEHELQKVINKQLEQIK